MPIQSAFKPRFRRTIVAPGSSTRVDIWLLYVHPITGKAVTVGVPHGDKDTAVILAEAWNTHFGYPIESDNAPTH